MRKIIAGFAVSLDGYMEGPNGEYDWMMENMDPGEDFAESINRFDCFLMGRRTYEKLLSYNDSSFKQFDNYVFSTTLSQVADGFKLVNDDPVEFLTKLKRQEGKNIALYGGADLLASLLELGMVDEISMVIIPILLGAGKPMVGRFDQRLWLDLLDVKTFKNGNIQLSYKIRNRELKE